MTESLQSRVRRLDNAWYKGGLRSLSEIDFVVMHDTQGHSGMSSIEWMNRLYDDDGKTPLPARKRSSYNYIIERDGTILRMAPVEVITFHSGDSWWPDPTPYPPGNGKSLNLRAIGVAWANGVGEELTEAQVESALWLCGVWCGEGKQIAVENVIGHYEVSPGRKTDPDCVNMNAWREKLSEYLSERAVA